MKKERLKVKKIPWIILIYLLGYISIICLFWVVGYYNGNIKPKFVVDNYEGVYLSTFFTISILKYSLRYFARKIDKIKLSQFFSFFLSLSPFLRRSKNNEKTKS